MTETPRSATQPAAPAIPVIAIDGPSGSGKGTIARRVATRLGFHLLDSGALYRLVALAGTRKRLDPDDMEAHARVAEALDVVFGADSAGEEVISLEGEDVTSAIRTETAGAAASRVAFSKEVCAFLPYASARITHQNGDSSSSQWRNVIAPSQSL